ncbi:MAG: SOS response-associated peptidase [Phenylobacterium sp.]|uniref:SOS response-associated peptidase n=1 Tax=Phenylobacterium sp. TaxID=1871053 RepID=UPI00273608D8|nr:SOS response-associated peptidase [Phenylobacterium sp.]MDP3115910.1 SOS response-associated peptidase [Phenylobacterium sp.]
MCNDYRYTKSPDTLREEFSQLKIPLRFSGDATPNYPPYDDIRPNQRAPIIRGGSEGVELSVTPWAWKSPNGKPVFNFRSEGRSFAKSDRCLIPSDGFYEFTKPDDPKRRLKDKHRFTLTGEPWFWIAGLVKEGSFAMLTTAPGPDIAPYHDRQIVVLPRGQGLDWLNLSKPEAEILRPLPEGSLDHQQVR